MRFQSCQIRETLLLGALAVAVVLSGCNGGGGGGGGGPMSGGGPRLSLTEQGEFSVKAQEAANSIPNPGGSVMQSSNRDDDDVTKDSISVTATRDANGQVTFVGSYDDGSGGDPEVRIGTENDLVTRFSGKVICDQCDTKPFGDNARWNGAELKKTYRDGTLWVDAYTDIEEPTTRTEGGSCGVGSTVSAGTPCTYQVGSQTFILRMEGSRVCFAFACVGGNIIDRNSNINGVPLTLVTTGSGNSRTISELSDNLAMSVGGTGTVQDTDYLAGGVWLYVPNSGAVDDFEFGAFADGSDPFEQGNIMALTGTATYQGDATGVYTEKESATATATFGYFDADVRLTANFGDGSTLGTISGVIDNAKEDGQAIDGNPSLNLGSADIGASNSGFFTGDTAMTLNDRNYAGKWGGQFYGNGDDPADHPGSVAGTFGGATSENPDGYESSFVGAYGAYKQ